MRHGLSIVSNAESLLRGKVGEVGMTKLEYLKFLDQGCPYSMNGKCELCNELSIRCDGQRFIHCYEFEHSEIGKEVNIE